MKREYLTTTDVLALHEVLVRRYGGSPEIRAQAIKFAEASANFEGCSLPESARPVVARYINGEIDMETAL